MLNANINTWIKYFRSFNKNVIYFNIFEHKESIFDIWPINTIPQPV